MHVCCIGKFNIPVFTCKIHFPFNSTKEKKKSAPLPHADTAEPETTQPHGNILPLCG